MIVEVTVPNQGLTITEATLTRWLRQPGESVQKGEPLFEIETDKAVQEIESPESGVVLAHLAQAGQVVRLGGVVAQIELAPAEGFESVSAPPARAAEEPVSRTVANPFARATNGQDAVSAPRREAVAVPSPRARRAAERLGVDLTTVQPTGGRGRHIRERDVLRAAERPVAPMPPEPPALAPASSVLRPIAPNRLRQITAERTAASFRDTPHFYLTREAQAERLVALRAEMVADLEGLTTPRVTITDMLIKALGLALREFPSLNSQWREGEIVPLETVDIGLAVDSPQGLRVPIVRHADRGSLVELARQREALVERAREGRSRPEDFEGGSFTLSNLGGLEVDQFEAIIVPPQSGILAVGAIKPRPCVVHDELAVRRTVFLTLSIDHRVVDGAEAGRFFQRLTRYVEHPAALCAL